MPLGQRDPQGQIVPLHEDVGQKEPAGHGKGVTEFAGQYFPAGHFDVLNILQ